MSPQDASQLAGAAGSTVPPIVSVNDFVVKFVAGNVILAPHWTGKISTVTQIVAVSAAMLSLAPIVPWTTALASVFVLASGVVYLIDATKQITAAGHGNADS